jgi:hypothetical protein
MWEIGSSKFKTKNRSTILVLKVEEYCTNVASTKSQVQSDKMNTLSESPGSLIMRKLSS